MNLSDLTHKFVTVKTTSKGECTGVVFAQIGDCFVMSNIVEQGVRKITAFKEDNIINIRDKI